MSFSKRRILILAAALAAGGVPGTAAFAAEIERTGGPYVPTPQVVVDQMLRIGKVAAGDYVIDLGSGDGVIVLTAATQHKASGVGVEIDPELVALSNDRAKKLGVADRARFVREDVRKMDVSKATVVTLYLLPGMMIDLRPKLFAELKPGTRIVSHDYHFGDWQADDQFSFDVPEKEKVNGVPRATIYKWVVPAKVQGAWQLRLAGGEQMPVSLQQKYQILEGTATTGGRAVKLVGPTLSGEQIEFSLPVSGQMARFSGKVGAAQMEGTAEVPGRGTVRWTATR